MIVFTFPGQGSQAPAMGAPWRDHPSWELVAEASEAVGRDLARLLLDAGADELRETRNSQIATFVLSLVVLDAVERLGAEPAFLAGHSLGEYTALVASGAIGFEEGARLVAERGEAMQMAAESTGGTMTAVLGLDDDQVEVACVATEGDVWVANFNAPGQVVIAGETCAVERAGEVARKLGAKRIMPLPVGGAFHTPYMAGAQNRLMKAIDSCEIRVPDVPVVANVDALAHTSPQEWSELLLQQLTSVVRWRSTLHNLADQGASIFVELGPGKVLSGLARKTVAGVTALAVNEPGQLDSLIEALAQPSTAGRGDEGEGLAISERIVVSPVAGVFTPDSGLEVGARLKPGSLLGHVNGTDVRSPFTGTVMGLLASEGERVVASQPIAWLRAG